MAVIQALLVMWAGLVLTHLLNAVTGDEQLGVTMPLLVFDAIMAAMRISVHKSTKGAET